MSDLIPFQFENHEIRTVVNGQDVLVVAKDVLLALEYTDTSNIGKSLDHVPNDWKGRYPIPTPGGSQEIWCLSEQGLYFFLGRSDKTKALPLQMWVAGDVLPAIRKTGKYETKKAKPRTPRLTSIISTHKALARLIVDVGGVKPGIAAAVAIGEIQKAIGVDAESYRKALPGIAETIESLNATNLGKLIGKSAREINRLLADMGLQMKNERDEWELTDKGKEYGAAYPYARNGHTSHQILWLPTTAKLLGH